MSSSFHQRSEAAVLSLRLLVDRGYAQHDTESTIKETRQMLENINAARFCPRANDRTGREVVYTRHEPVMEVTKYGEDN